jgi:hypothetical protein
MKFGTLAMPHVLSITHDQPRVQIELALSGADFAFRDDGGGKGSRFTISGEMRPISQVARDQISALADGTARILDLEESTLTVLEKCLRYQTDSTWADNTAESQSAGGTPFTLLGSASDYVYFGHREKFNKLQFDLQTLGSYGPEIWQYSRGTGSWGILMILNFSSATVTIGAQLQNAFVNVHQNKGFWAAGRFWTFYFDGANLCFTTSLDGVTWAAATTVRVITTGGDFSVVYDPTSGYGYYAAVQSRTAGTSKIFFRRFTLNSDGTITYSAAEQTAVTSVANTFYFEPTITVTTLGYVYIGYGLSVSGSQTPYITKSTATDGTWSPATSFPFQLTSTANAFQTAIVLNMWGLGTDNVLAIYGVALASAKSRYFSGGAWAAEQNIGLETDASGVLHSPAVVQSNGSDVHMLTPWSAGGGLYSKKWIGSANAWDPSYVSIIGSPTAMVGVLVPDMLGDVYCFWLGNPTANHVYYKRWDRSTATWDPAATDYFTGTNFKDNTLLSGFWNGGCVALLYNEANGASNIDIKFKPLMPGSDGTSGFTQDGDVPFTPPADWKRAVVNIVSDKFWFRVKAASVTTPATVNQIQINTVYLCIMLDPHFEQTAEWYDRQPYAVTFAQKEDIS